MAVYRSFDLLRKLFRMNLMRLVFLAYTIAFLDVIIKEEKCSALQLCKFWVTCLHYKRILL
jgi:hypothetical protein